MFAPNIALVIIGLAIPIVTETGWSMAKKTLVSKSENKSHNGTVLNESIAHKLTKWLYRHKSKFNIIVAILVTMIEFFALMSF